MIAIITKELGDILGFYIFSNIVIYTFIQDENNKKKFERAIGIYCGLSIVNCYVSWAFCSLDKTIQ